MQTEELVLQPRPRDTLSLSPALQDETPSDWQLTDAHGRPVHLSSAGMVLYFGRSYRLRVAAAKPGEPPPELRVVSCPSFLRCRHDAQPLTKHGHTYRCLSLDPCRLSGWLRPFKAAYEVLCDDLEVECVYNSGSEPLRLTLSIPVVARTAWSAGIALLTCVGAPVGWLLAQAEHLFANAMTHGSSSLSEFIEWWPAPQTNPRFWLWPLTLAILNLIMAFASNLWLMLSRSRELEERFKKERGPAVAG